MNIQTLESTPAKKNKGQKPLPFNMNNFHGGGGYMGPPMGGGYPPQHFGPAPGNYQYDAYGNPNPMMYNNNYGDGSGFVGGHGPYPPQQQQQFYPQGQMVGGSDLPLGGSSRTQEELSYVRRDPLGAQPVGPPPQQANSNYMRHSGGEGAPPEERILRHPHPHVPIGGRQDEEHYDPRLPTYNATPMYHSQYAANQAAQSQTPIVAPTISSIFQIAAERISKKLEQPTERVAPPRSPIRLAPSRSPIRDNSIRVAPARHRDRSPSPVYQRKVPTPVSSAPPPSMSGNIEIITGLVTQMQDMFGMVSKEIFFQTSTVVGGMPEVGDKVVVEAERVSGMPFKFNAKRVQMLSKDLLDKDDKKHSSKSSRKSSDKSSSSSRKKSEDMDFGPLPSMPSSLNLYAKPSSPIPLRSILKRNPPPPPILSKSGKAVAAGNEKYRPESPVGFSLKNGSFSLDLRGDFPVIKQPKSDLEQLYPELMFVNDKKPERQRSRDRDKSPTERRRRSSTSPKRRSKSPKRRSRSKSPKRGRSRSPKRRSRSRSPKRRSSASPKRRSRSPKRRSRSRSPKRRSRSPKKRSISPRRKSSPRRRSRSRSKDKERRRSSPGGRRRSNSRERERLKRNNKDKGSPPLITIDDEEQQKKLDLAVARANETHNQMILYNNILMEQQAVEAANNPFAHTGLAARVNNSDLFPKVPDYLSLGGEQNEQKAKGQQQAIMMPNKPARPIAPIKFSIGNPQGVPPPIAISNKLVPNPAYNPRAQGPPPKNAVYLQNPNFNPNASASGSGWPLPQATISTSASLIVQSVEQALKKSKRKNRKDEAQEPAYKIQQKEQLANLLKAQQEAARINNKLEASSVEKNQEQRMAELRSSLTEKQKLQVYEQERELLKQKKAVDAQLNLTNNQQLQQFKKNVEDKLKGLRETFESRTGKNNNNGSSKNEEERVEGNMRFTEKQLQSQEEVEEIREEVQREKFMDEERRLKASGNTPALQLLWKNEEKRRRRFEEARIERLRIQEIKLKKSKQWTELKKLREQFGDTAEREAELMRLREIRKREEMEEEEEAKRIQILMTQQDQLKEQERWIREEEEVRRRADERSQRGTEGPVRRLVMDTQMKQIQAAQIDIKGGRGSRRSPSITPPRRSSRERRRVRSPQRRRRSRTRSKSAESSRRIRRSRSKSRERNSRRERTPEREVRIIREVPLDGVTRVEYRELPREMDPEEYAFLRQQEEYRRREEEERAIMMSQMEAVRMQEEILVRQEREIYERMQMVERGYYQQQGEEERYHHHQDSGRRRF